MYTACFTGHRQLKGKYEGEEWNRLYKFMNEEVFPVLVEQYKITKFITGMATGVDMLGAELVMQNRIKYKDLSLEAYVPYKNQYKIWPKFQQQRYHTILKACDNVKILFEDNHANWKLQKRNERMVDNSNYVIAIWNGKEHGGTYNCFKYAEKKKKPMIRIDPISLRWINLSWIISI